MTIHPVVSEEGRLHVKALVVESVARLERGSQLKIGPIRKQLRDLAADDLQSNYVGMRQVFIEELSQQVDLVVRQDLLPTPQDASDEADTPASGSDADQADAPASSGDAPTRQADLHAASEEDLATAVKAARGAFNWLGWRSSVWQ